MSVSAIPAPQPVPARRLSRWVAALAEGLPAASTRLTRVGAALGGAAVLWMLAVAAWGINAPFGDGHFASTAAIGVAGDNMWRHHIFYPLHYYVDAFPVGVNYYMHHPLGMFWVAALAVKVFGAHNWAIRLPAVFYSTASPFLLYRLGRATWGPLEGAISAWAFVALPITLGFSSFHALEGPVIFSLLLASWGYVRFDQTRRAGYALASLLGFFWAMNHDWAAYVWGAVFLFWLFLRLYAFPRRAFGDFDARAMGRYWALMVVVALAAFLGMAGLLISTNKLSELLGMYSLRSAGSGVPLSLVLQVRHVWIELMFPGLAILLGKLAVPVIVGRFAVRRRDAELLPLVMLVTAVVQYVHFKQGADVHIFWPQYFAPYFAMGMGAMAATLRDGFGWLRPRLSGKAGDLLGRHGVWLGSALAALPLLFVFKDGASMVRLAQESGGRFNSPLLRTDIDRVDALRWWIPRFGENERIAFHPSVEPVHWSLNWELRPHALTPRQPMGDRGTRPRAYTLDSRYISSAELRQAAKLFHVNILGPFWLIDRSEAPRPLDGFSFDEREPGPLEWYLHGGWEPMRTVRVDPFTTWEWRTLLGQPAVRPAAQPVTTEQVRIAHNAALAAGDQAGAARYRQELERRLDAKPTADFDDGTRLIGLEHHRGAERALVVYFVAGPKARGYVRFAIHAHVDKPARLSTLAWDKDVIDVDQRPSIPTDLWQPGHIYAVKGTYRKRPGTERFFGSFVTLDGTRPPARVGGVHIELLTVN